MSIKIALKDVLANLMKTFNLNTLELERVTGIPSSTLYRLLKNEQGNPTIDVLKKLAAFFHISVSQLIGEEPLGCKHIPVIPSTEIISFLNNPLNPTAEYKTIPVDIPLSSKCFAIVAQDDLMEPFIRANSLVIIDPDREFFNKDFVVLIKHLFDAPQIRQVIKDGSHIYTKVMNPQYELSLSKLESLKDYAFTGTIVHYRTNLMNFDNEASLKTLTKITQKNLTSS